jgi:hypothetical protein
MIVAGIPRRLLGVIRGARLPAAAGLPGYYHHPSGTKPPNLTPKASYLCDLPDRVV